MEHPDPARKLSANVYVLVCVQWRIPDDGQRNCPKHVEFHSKIKILRSGWNILILLTNCQQVCMYWCVYSGELLMMGRGTVRNM